jgi:hypothetical protein
MNMTGIEALVAIRDGKHIRRVDWKPGDYIRMNRQTKKISYVRGTTISILIVADHFLHDDWEAIDAKDGE